MRNVEILNIEASKLSQQSPEQLHSTLRAMLKDLTNNSPILGAAIFSVEGLPLVSHFYGGTEEVTIAAMVAGMYGAGELSVKELKQGNLKSIIVEGDYGKTVVIAITDGYLLTVTAPENAKLGLVFNDSKRFAREAGKLLRGLI